MPAHSRPVSEVLTQPLLFVVGKGGVGKTTVSRAIAEANATGGKRTLWVEFENPKLEPGELNKITPHLSHLNCSFFPAFEEYAELRLKNATIAKLFASNKFIRYLAQAAPGMRELILIGKVWSERQNFERVVVDMPSTGYSIAMFQAVVNFGKLFSGGTVHANIDQMLTTFNDPKQLGLLILALPEEMPLQESLELGGEFKRLLPENPPAFLVNRTFPRAQLPSDISENPTQWTSPLPSSAADYVIKRGAREKFNLEAFANLTYDSLEFLKEIQKLSQILGARYRVE